MKKDRIYYRWFTTDWFGSRTRAALDPACRAVYRDFIDFCLDCGDTGYAQDNGKPLSLDDLALLLATPRQTAAEVKDCLCTLMDRDNVLASDEGYYNARALEEAAWRRTQTAAGRKGGQASGNARSRTVEPSLNDRSTTVQRPLNHSDARVSPEPEPESEPETESKDGGTIVPLSPAPPGTARRASPCPLKEIVGLWNSTVTTQPPVKDGQLEGWLKRHGAAIRARWQESATRQSLPWWEAYFQSIRDNAWLSGQEEGRDERCFIRGLEWFIGPKNLLRVESGEFHLRAERRNPQSQGPLWKYIDQPKDEEEESHDPDLV